MKMTGGNSYNELWEKVARQEVILGMTDSVEAMIDILTQMQGLNATLQAYRGAIDGQLAELQAFHDSVGAQIEGLKKKNKDLKVKVNILLQICLEEVKNMPRSKFWSQNHLMV